MFITIKLTIIEHHFALGVNFTRRVAVAQPKTLSPTDDTEDVYPVIGS